MNNLNYGVIGNCRSAALISDKGSIDWCCLPDFDSSSVFAKLLDQEKGGSFSIEVDDTYTVTQAYMRRTNILCTAFKSDKGVFEIIDFMPRYKISDNDYFTPAEIYRYIRYVSGTPAFKIIYDPRLNYARDTVLHKEQENHIRSYSAEWPTDCIYLYSSLKLSDIASSSTIELSRDEFTLLSYNQKLIEIDIDRGVS